MRWRNNSAKKIRSCQSMIDYAVALGSLVYTSAIVGLAFSGHVNPQLGNYLAGSAGVAVAYGQYRVSIKPLREWLKSRTQRLQHIYELTRRGEDRILEKILFKE